VPALPDGPSDSSSLQTLRLLRDSTSYLSELRELYGGAFTLRPLYSPALVVVCDPALVRVIFTGDSTMLHAGEANRILEPASGPKIGIPLLAEMLNPVASSGDTVSAR
jgi:hypothetical protein